MGPFSTLAQDELPKDTDVLRTLARHNRIQVGDAGLLPCAGVDAVVEASGTVQVGDPVALACSENRPARGSTTRGQCQLTSACCHLSFADHDP
jgi:hypothetical protein